MQKVLFVMSDIHIYPSGRIPEKFKSMVEHVKAKKPDMVFITEDHTNGNRGDSYGAGNFLLVQSIR